MRIGSGITDLPQSAVARCAAVPIRTPGHVQSHGALLILDESERITAASANCPQFLGQTADALLGRSLGSVLPGLTLAGSDSDTREFTWREYDGTWTRQDQTATLELVRPGFDPVGDCQAIVDALARPIGLDKPTDLRKILRALAPAIGYDRAKLYKFDADWHGQVVAEELLAPMPALFGLWFPATDIPAQARDLYLTHRVHVIADTSAEDVPIVCPADSAAFDLSHSRIRGIMDSCKSHFSNRGVRASLTAPIIVDGRLWGLLSFHHATPRWPSPRLARLVDSAGRVVSDRIAAHVQRDRTEGASLAQQQLREFPGRTAPDRHWAEGLICPESGLGRLVASNDCALVTAAQAFSDRGIVSAEVWHQLADWLETQAVDGLFTTECLGRVTDEFAGLAPDICGLMALRIPQTEQTWLIWIRGEQAREVTWAGDPRTGLVVVNGQAELQPRQSFAAVSELIRGYCAPWSLSDRAVAQETIRLSFLDVIVSWQRQQTEQLREHYAYLFSQVGDAVITTDRDGIITYYNPAAERIFGYKAKERLGRPIWSNYPPDRQGEIRAMFDKIREGGEFIGEWSATTKDGRSIWLDARNQPIRDAYGKVIGLLGISRDITDRKSAYLGVLRMQTLLNETESLAQIGSWEWTPGQSTEFWSPGHYRIFGLRPGTPIEWDRLIPAMIHEEDRATVRRQRSAIVATGQAEPVEYRITRPDGQLRRIVNRARLIRGEAGQSDRIIGTVQDVTEHRAAEELLRESELRYRLLAENAGDMITRHGRDGAIVYASPACRSLLGYEPAELVGVRSLDLVFPDDQEAARGRIDSLRFQPEPLPATLRLVRKDGEVIWVEAITRLSGPPDDPTSEMIICTRDISERVRLESQLRQTAKLEAVGRLAGGVAHDFNNLLSIVIAYGTILGKSLTHDPALQEAAGQIVASGQRGAALTRQLLAFSRQQSVELHPVHLNDEINQTIDLLARLIGEDIVIERDLEPGLPWVLLTSDQLGQVLMNLAVNARDAMPQGGVLKIATRLVSLAPQAIPGETAEEPRPFVELRVSDSGVGMDDQTRAHIFEPFFTTKKEHGTGLGLSTVYGIVLRAGGLIDVASAPNSGTTFTIHLPACDPGIDDALAMTESIPISTNVLKGKRVLLVEDSTEVRQLMADLVRSQGMVAIEASNSEEALRLSRESDQPIDLLLTDMIMPGVNGQELAAAILARRPQTRVVFMSGYTGSSLPVDGSGPSRFIQKPFVPDELFRVLREAITDTPPPGSGRMARGFPGPLSGT